MWVVLITVSVFCFALARVIQKKILNDKNQDTITYAIFFQLLVSLLILPTTFINGFKIPPLDNLWINMILMVVFYGVANIFSYQSIKRIPISEFMIILATTPIWTSLTSIPLLGESSSIAKIIGILLTVLGIVIVFYNKSTKLNIGHLLAILTALCFGFAFTNDAFLLGSFDPLTYSTMYFALPAIFVALLYPMKIRNFGYLISKHNRIRFLSSTFLYALAALAVNLSFKSGGEISQISAILQLTTIIIVVLGVFFLNERENLFRKILGGLIVVLGAILVSIR